MSVTFRYTTPPSPGADGSGDAAFCAHHFGPLHMELFGEWDGYAGVKMQPIDGTSAVIFVPEIVPGRYRLFVYDVNLCPVDPDVAPITGRGFTANGVALTSLETLDGHEAASFTLEPDGSVSP